MSRAAIALGVAGSPVCIHAGPGSFADVDGGGAAVVVGFLAVDCTVVVPTFTPSLEVVPPPPALRPRRNGVVYERMEVRDARRAFDPAGNDVDPGAGGVAEEVLAMPTRRRGAHPLLSFTAVGPEADAMIVGQSPEDVYAPLDAVARSRGAVVLAGCGLSSMTLLHAAERDAGRAPFVRAARVAGRGVIGARVAGCARGFDNLRPVVEPFSNDHQLGATMLRSFGARSALDAASFAIRRDRRLTRCHLEECLSCEDAIAGGPIGPLRLV
ncbi:MAG TPA: AAC(3) family N-acetyltransferase [Acidimicrobiales bacterium]|nr:AAC(3) family N-acetyltransferase [Acidimicrobiales bacterium]